MLKHENFFWSFLRKIIKNGFKESIKLTESMLFKENNDIISIEKSVNFWISLLSKEEILNEYILSKFFEQLMVEILDLISTLNLNYKEVKESQTFDNEKNINKKYPTTMEIENEQLFEDLENEENKRDENYIKNPINNIFYEAYDSDDLEVYNRTCIFLKKFFKKFKNERLLNPWILFLIDKFMNIGNNHPHISQTYTCLTSIMNYCSRINFFQLNDKETIFFVDDFELFIFNLCKKIEIFLDDLLLNSIEFILGIPSVIIKLIIKKNSNFEILKNIFKKTFKLGFHDIRYSKLALKSLKNWIYENSFLTIDKGDKITCNQLNYSKKDIDNLNIEIPLLYDNGSNLNNDIQNQNKNQNVNVKYNSTDYYYSYNQRDFKKANLEFIREILPVFGEYLIEYEKIKSNIDVSNFEYFEKYNKIQNEILEILGELGGEAHFLIESTSMTSELNNINTENVSNQIKSFSNSNPDGINNKQQRTLLDILNPKSIDYLLPLYNKKYKIFFDNIILTVSEIAENSYNKEKKYSAAELFHAIILYIIGLETKREKMQNKDILKLMINKILILSCDMEKGISGIFEPLIFQIIHWIAKKGHTQENSKDIFEILDVIIENTTSRKCAKIRELSSDCLAEYVKWFIKQHSDITLKEKSHTIKYIIRKIETLAGHPDNFKKLGAVISFDKIIGIIALNDFLVDKFILEIAFYIFNIIKNNSNTGFIKNTESFKNNGGENILNKNHKIEEDNKVNIYINKVLDKKILKIKSFEKSKNFNNNMSNFRKTWDELNEIIFENINNAIIKLKIIFAKKFAFLIKINPKRLLYKDLRVLFIDLVEKITANEIELRNLSSELIIFIFDLFKQNNFAGFNKNSEIKEIFISENLRDILKLENIVYTDIHSNNNLNNEIIHNSIFNKLKNIKNLSIKYDFIRFIILKNVFTVDELFINFEGIIDEHIINIDFSKILFKILDINVQISEENFSSNEILDFQSFIYIIEVIELIDKSKNNDFCITLLKEKILKIHKEGSIDKCILQEGLKELYNINHIENLEIFDIFLLSIRKLIIPNEKKTSFEKIFIFSHFETVSEIIKKSYAKLLNLILKNNLIENQNKSSSHKLYNYIYIKLQNFLFERVEFFNIDWKEKKNNYENGNSQINFTSQTLNDKNSLNFHNLSNNLSSINFSESTVEFYFDILFKIRHNLSADFCQKLKKNILNILEIKNPKLNILLKFYYNFIYYSEFSYALKLLTENEYNFDLIADWFYTLILTENQNTEFKIYDKRKINKNQEVFKIPISSKEQINNNKSKNIIESCISNKNENLMDFDFTKENIIYKSKINDNSINKNCTNSKSSIDFKNSFLGLEKEKIIEKFVEECALNENKIFLLFILTEKAILGKNYNIVSFIAKVFVDNLIKFSNIDAIINQIKISNLLIFNYLENSIFSVIELEKIFKLIDMYLTEKSINIIKEIVNFLGLFVKLFNINQANEDDDNLILNNNYGKYQQIKASNNYFITEKLEKIRFYYITIQSKYFPIKSRYLKPNSREHTDFQLIYNCFLNTFKTVKSLEFLELLFPIIREEKTEYSIRVKASIKEYIQDILDNKNAEYRLKEIQKTIDIFLNKEIDKNLKDNIRFSIMKIITLKFLKKCNMHDLKEIFVKNYKTLFEIVKGNILDSSLSYEMKFILILEK